jgi:hypothetical protein
MGVDLVPADTQMEGPMKLYVIPAIAALVMTGCAAMDPLRDVPTLASNFSPTISKNGTKGFTFTAVGNGDATIQATAEDHERMISRELGRRQFCMNGYDILGSDRKASESGSSYVVTYTGRCK